MGGLLANDVKIPVLKSRIKFIKHRELPEKALIKNATISRNGEKYYISFTLEWEENEKEPVFPQKIVGLDYSQNDFYVNSEGKKANYPHFYCKTEKRIGREQRKLAKMESKSSNWWKQKRKIHRLQEKIVNQRKDWLHKESFCITEEFDAVCVEDIDLRNIAQCLSLGKNLHDNGFGMFRLFLQYKLEDRGKHFVKIGKWYPSSKLCHSCGAKKESLELNERSWICEVCGVEHDRDYNAAVNIRNEGKRLLATVLKQK